MVKIDIINNFIKIYLEDQRDKVIMILIKEVTEVMELIALEIYSLYVVIKKSIKVLYIE